MAFAVVFTVTAVALSFSAAAADRNDLLSYVTSDVIADSPGDFELPGGCTYLSVEGNPKSTGNSVSAKGTNEFRISPSGSAGSDSTDILFTVDDEKTLSEIDTLVFRIFCSGTFSEGYTSSINKAVLTVTSSSGDVYTSVAAFPFSSSSLMYFDMSRTASEDTVSKISLKIFPDSERAKSGDIYVSLPAVTDGIDFSFQKANSLDWLSVCYGYAVQDSGTLTVSASATDDSTGLTVGTVILTGDTDISPMKGKDEGPDDDHEREYIKKENVTYCNIRIKSGNGIIEGTDYGYGGAGKYQLQYSDDVRNVIFRLNDHAVRVVVRSGSDTVFSDFVFEDAEIESGAVNNLAMIYEDGHLDVSGSLRSEDIRDNMAFGIGLYMSDIISGEDDVLLGTVSSASRFEFHIDMSDYPHAMSQKMYYLAFITGDGKMVRLCNPRFAGIRYQSAPSGPVYGLADADPVISFESDASNVIVPVDLSRLYAGDAVSGISVSRNGYVFSLDAGYLEELDEALKLYNMSDVAVYAKLYFSGTLRSKITDDMLTCSETESGESILDIYNKEAVSYYTSAVSFLVERYPKIASFIISSSVNRYSTTGYGKITVSSVNNGFADIYSYAKYLAMISEITYGASSEQGRSITVVFPFSSGDGNDIISDIETLAVYIAEGIKIYGQIHWGIQFDAAPGTDTGVSAAIFRIIQSCETSSPDFMSYVFYPEMNGDITAQYGEFCESCDSSATRAVFLSMDSFEYSYGAYNEVIEGLKSFIKDDGTVYYQGSAVTVSDIDPSLFGYIWDFSGAHSTFGWKTGYGISSLRTIPVRNGPETYRVLRIETDPSGGTNAGVALVNFGEPMDMSSGTVIKFVIDIGSGTLPDSLVFVLGNNESRAEYSCSEFGDGGTFSFFCDASEFSLADNITYMGIIIYSDVPATVDVRSVSQTSAEVHDEEESLREKANGFIKGLGLNTVQATVIILAAIALIIVIFKILSVLNRKDLRNKIKKRKK